MAKKKLTPAEQEWIDYCLQLPAEQIVILRDNETYKYGLADSNTWKMIAPLVYDECIPCEADDTAFAMVQKGKKCFLIDKAARPISTLLYEHIVHVATIAEEKINTEHALSHAIFNQGARKAYDGKAWGLIDSKGQPITPFKYEHIMDGDEGLVRICQHGRWGLMNEKGEEIVPCQYAELAGEFYDGIAIMAKDENGPYGFVDKTGKEITPCIYNHISDFRCGYAEVERDGRWMLVDTTGKEFAPEGYEAIGLMREGLAVVRKNGLEGYVDITGKEIIPCIYEHATGFKEGIAQVKIDGKYGMINRAGEDIVPCIYDYFSTFFEEFDVPNLIKAHQNGQIGIFNSAGKELLPCQYDTIDDFHDGYARVLKDGLCGLISTEGAEIIPFVYDEIQDNFMHGYVFVKNNGFKGVVELPSGKEIIPCIYQHIFAFHDGIAAVERNGKWGCINLAGEEIIPCEYELIYPHICNIEDRIAMKKNGRMGIMDTKTGKEIVPFIYKDISNYFEGLVRVSKNNKAGFLDHEGNAVVPCIYDSVYDFSEGFAAVCKDDLWGYIDHEGKELTPCIYEDAYMFFPGGNAPVKRNGLWGFIDKTGKEIVPCVYYDLEFVELMYKGSDFVSKDPAGKSKWGVIDTKGNEIIPCHYASYSIRTETSLKHFLPCHEDSTQQLIYVVKRTGRFAIVRDTSKK